MNEPASDTWREGFDTDDDDDDLGALIDEFRLAGMKEAFTQAEQFGGLFGAGIVVRGCNDGIS